MAATSHIPGVFAPAVHALHSSIFNIQLPVSTPLTDLPDDIMEPDHELAPCLEVEASKGTPEPTLLHPQPSEHEVSDEVVRQQIMDGLTLSSEDREVVEEATRGQNTNILVVQATHGCHNFHSDRRHTQVLCTRQQNIS